MLQFILIKFNTLYNMQNIYECHASFNTHSQQNAFVKSSYFFVKSVILKLMTLRLD